MSPPRRMYPGAKKKKSTPIKKQHSRVFTLKKQASLLREKLLKLKLRTPFKTKKQQTQKQKRAQKQKKHARKRKQKKKKKKKKKTYNKTERNRTFWPNTQPPLAHSDTHSDSTDTHTTYFRIVNTQ